MSLPPTTVDSAADPHARSQAHTGLRGPWLVVARVTWITVVALAVVVFGAALPVFFQASRTILSPETQVPGQLAAADVQLMQQWGLSLDLYAAYQTAVIVLMAFVLTVAGALLFWRKSNDPIAVFVSLWFVLFGLCGSPVLDPLVRANPTWHLPVRFL